MTSLFDEKHASTLSSKLAMRVYTSRLLGQDADLVLHGGGNTSVKIDDTIYVKGSGWDLSSIEEPGFSPVDLGILQKMATRDHLSDTQMVKEQREALRDSSAPNPSIEAILHAIIPFEFVDHTHADAVVTLSNTPDGKALIEEVYGDTVLIIDYVMPGFLLAKDIYEKTKDMDWSKLEGIVLLNHGIFTFNDDAKKSYEKMIELVTKAEAYIYEAALLFPKCISGEIRPAMLDELQNAVSKLRGTDITLKVIDTIDTCTLSKRLNIEAIVHRGGLTPEHVIRIKPFPAIIENDVQKGLDKFVSDYKTYFRENATDTHICLDLAPRYAIVKGAGVVTFGKDDKEASVIGDIVEHTAKAMLTAEHLGGWQSLKPSDIFDMEYWELEQNKLKK
ncbi:MAG: class II aldolase/adducin family protein [Campylobacterota bacterium]|nr:class II aldolase/adducin family protein [Campylobacterota bacterium]